MYKIVVNEVNNNLLLMLYLVSKLKTGTHVFIILTLQLVVEALSIYRKYGNLFLKVNPN